MRVITIITSSENIGVYTRAGKSKSLIRWKRLKGGKRREKAGKGGVDDDDDDTDDTDGDNATNDDDTVDDYSDDL